MGGECTNTGCVPSKAFIHLAYKYHTAVITAGHTPATDTFRDTVFTKVQEKIASVLKEETVTHFEALGITIIFGEAIFTSENTVQVGATSYKFHTAIIATGSSPRLLDTPGIETATILTNQNFFEQTTLPKRLLIIGSGPIGLELGQACAMLGSEVTIASRDSELGRLEDVAIRSIITHSCEKLGIQVEYGVVLEKVEHGVAMFHQATPDGTKSTLAIPHDAILVAIGRVPNLPQGLNYARVTATSAGITVNAHYQTSNPHIYALGDVADRFKFTHVADAVARQVVGRILSKGLLGVQISAIPKVTYLTPEVAQVGMHFDEAVGAYGADRLYRLEVPLATLDRAITDGTTDGVAIVIVTRLTGKILGAHIAAPRAGEIIALFTLAIDQRLSLWKLRRSIYAYPTYTQIIKKIADEFFVTQLQNLKRDLLATLRRSLPKIIFVGLWAIALYALWQWKEVSGQSWEAILALVFTTITSTIWGPLLYILLYTIRPLTLFPGAAMTVLSGTFFGLWGILYTIIGANLSATLAYVVGRYLGGSSAHLLPTLHSLSLKIKTNPFLTILTMRLIFMPFDAVNYGAGILRVPFLPYLTATIIGTILGIVTFVSIGASVSVETFLTEGVSFSAINPWFIGLSLFIFVLSLVVSQFLSQSTKAPL
jgi:pyruvate/2-oxoglutarate dehydrogenase complex dihydrolipoamide dehydrogenase (E3) component/uncharacterized membrane protein YdjX (TVP38/TMEM64 family)